MERRPWPVLEADMPIVVANLGPSKLGMPSVAKWTFQCWWGGR